MWLRPDGSRWLTPQGSVCRICDALRESVGGDAPPAADVPLGVALQAALQNQGVALLLGGAHGDDGSDSMAHERCVVVLPMRRLGDTREVLVVVPPVRSAHIARMLPSLVPVVQ